MTPSLRSVCVRALLSTLSLAMPLSAQQPESAVPCSTIEPIPITYGQHTSGCSISPATDVDVFTLQGNKGDPVRFRLAGLSNNLDPVLTIYDPTGMVLATPACSSPSYSTCTFEHDEVLPQAGTYTLVVSDSGTDNTGNYLLQVERVPPLFPVPGIPRGATVTDTISPGTDIDYFTFQAAQGDLVQFALQGLSNNLDPVVEICDSTGAAVVTKSCASPSYSACSISFSQTFTQGGTYYVVVYDSGADNTGSFNLSVTCLLGSCPGSSSGLSASPGTIQIANGGRQNYLLDAGAAHAGDGYLLLGSLNGTLPGIPFGGVLLPLNFEPGWFLYTASNANNGALVNTLGTLDGSGQASASLVLPAFSDPSLVGTVLNHAYLVWDPQTLRTVLASNAVTLTLQ